MKLTIQRKPLQETDEKPLRSFSSILDCIGNTPLLYVDGIYAKLETTNPTGSIKDRMAAFMTSQAEERGELKPGSKIIEVTSGNTGISFAMISALRGYRFTAIMPENMSVERRKMMAAFGASVVLTPARDDIVGAMKKLDELARQNRDAWLPKQFENPDNAEAHRLGTGKEIVDHFHGKVDAFVAGTGTGGTLIGVAKALRKASPYAKVFAVEPEESPVMFGGEPGVHKIQGIGEGFIPRIVSDNFELIEDVITIKSDDAIKAARELARRHGIFVGISSGANFLAAKQLSQRFQTVVTVFPDRGERYLSTEMCE